LILMPELTRKLALSIIQKLKTGKNLLEGVEHFSAGRDRWFDATEEILKEIEDTDESVVRFIKGGYGDGKTHFIAQVRARALGRNWVSSYIEVSSQMRLNHFNEVFSAIVGGCVTQKMLDEHNQIVDPGDLGGLQWILGEWLDRLIHLHSGDLDFGAAHTMVVKERVDGSVDSVLRKCRAHGDFAAAVHWFVDSRLKNSKEENDLLMRWFAAENVHSAQSGFRLQFRSKGILSSINRRNAKEILRSLASFLPAIGYSGLIIFVDELDLLLEYTPKPRKEAYITLRELIDNVDGQHGMKRTYFSCAIIPDLITSPKGFSEYEALSSRLEETNLEEFSDLNLVDYRATIVDLKKAKLSQADHLEICRKIRNVHAVARDWNPRKYLSDKQLREFVKLIHKQTLGRTTARILCMAITKYLEALEQNRGPVPPPDTLQIVEGAVHKGVSRE